MLAFLKRLQNKTPLKIKLVAAFMAVATLLFLTGVTAYISSLRVQGAYNDILNKSLAEERAIGQMKNATKDKIRFISKLSVNLLNKDEFAIFLKKIETLDQSYTNGDTVLSAHVEGEKQQMQYKELVAVSKKLDSSINEIIDLYKQNMSNPDRVKLVQIYYSELEAMIETMFANLDNMGKMIGDSVLASEKRATETANWGNKMTIGVVTLGFFLALFSGVALASYLSGNLTQVANELNTQAQKVADVSRLLIESSMEVQQRTVRQLEAIELTANTTVEIEKKINQNAGDAKISSEKSKSSQNAVEGVRVGIQNLNESVSKINQSTQKIAEEIHSSHKQMMNVVELIKEISDKTQVINDIVFQTKLLSFNASVEAARAGEAGKGFSVVAQEVGSLAESSGTAAREIGMMLSKSVESVESMVSEMREKVDGLLSTSQKTVTDGATSSATVARLFESVESGMKDVMERIGNISVATQEESVGLNAVRKSVVQLRGLASENSQVVQSFEEQAQSLRDQAEGVRQVVEKLQSIVVGQRESIL